jgi:dGTPase
MTSIREKFQDREKSFISPQGCLSVASRGRLRPEPECPIRTPFQRDRDRIVYSNAFRRLKYKTQVFLTPLGLADHYRTRLTHTLEVAEISRVISRAMRLNEDLAEAIALGHDLGHTPFGHSGETVLKEIFSRRFTHQAQSLRVVDLLERNGRGLNLSNEVRDGILKHSKGYGKIMPEDPDKLPYTMEGRVVRFADIMAYLNHDLDDAIRSRVISLDEVPGTCLEIIGNSHSERATRMISDLIHASEERSGVLEFKMSETMYDAMITLRKFLYARVYRASRVHGAFVKAKKILSELYHYLMGNQDQLQTELSEMEMDCCHTNGEPLEQIVCDCIASMTDQRALSLYEKLFFPAPPRKGPLQ